MVAFATAPTADALWGVLSGVLDPEVPVLSVVDLGIVRDIRVDESGTEVTVTPTDGMVSVDSAKWGHFRGCIPADHYHVIGQLRRSVKDVYTGFDAARFYGWLANDLAGRGL